MSSANNRSHPDHTTDEDPLESIREHESEVEKLAERNDRIGAGARYLLAIARGEVPDRRDADMAGLPRLQGGGGQ